MKLPRAIVHIVYDAERKLWLAKAGGMVVDHEGTKSDLVERCALRLTGLFVRSLDVRRVLDHPRPEHWFRGQLVVHTKDGRIEYERTYGADPRKTRG